jgi:hypothetical protein
VVIATLLVIGFLVEESEDSYVDEYEEKSVEESQEDEVRLFLESNYPSLLRKWDSIESAESEVEEKIVELEDLKAQFPSQSSRIDRYINRWRGVHSKIENSISKVKSRVEKLYVSYKISGINGDTQLDIVESDSELSQEIDNVIAEIDLIDEAYRESDGKVDLYRWTESGFKVCGETLKESLPDISKFQNYKTPDGLIYWRVSTTGGYGSCDSDVYIVSSEDIGTI